MILFALVRLLVTFPHLVRDLQRLLQTFKTLGGGRKRHAQTTVLLFIPVSPYTETNYVRCDARGELFVSDMSVFDLPNCSGDEVRRSLKRRVSPIIMTLAIGGLLLCVLPIIGLAVSGLALLLTWRGNRHWTRSMSIVATVISSIVTLPFSAACCVGQFLDSSPNYSDERRQGIFTHLLSAFLVLLAPLVFFQ